MEEQRVARTEAATSALIAEVQKLMGRSRVASQRATALQLTVMSAKAETTSDALAKAVLLAESASLSSHLGNRAAAVDGAVRVGQLIPTFGDEAAADLLPNGCRSDRSVTSASNVLYLYIYILVPPSTELSYFTLSCSSGYLYVPAVFPSCHRAFLLKTPTTVTSSKILI